ncbi:hypothetical protein KBY76_11285 [Synechococcus sp. GreenBA-s]|nr:hypothetical protein [Synechococcus sp. GreenBA-s]
MESSPDQTAHRRIQSLLSQGELQAARDLAYQWLRHWVQSHPSQPRPSELRHADLWASLADIIERTHDDYLAELFWQSLDAVEPPSLSQQAIPLLGIPILNRLDLLHQLLDSLDYPVQTLAIVDNSPTAGLHSTLTRDLEALQRQGHPQITQIEVARPFRNLGVAGSWNLILTSFPEASWALLANNDIRFAPGVLAAAASRLNESRPQFLPLLPEPQSFSAFLITAKTWDRLGLFDTNFYPAYCEDLDYRDRMRADTSVECIEVPQIQTAMTHLNREHSATIASDPSLEARNRVSFQLNRLWYFSQRRIRHDPRGSWVRRWLGSWDR